MLSIKENCKSVEEFNLLYDSVGWGAYSKEITKKALDNTYYSVSIYEDDNIVGYGRLIGDTICFMYIQDVEGYTVESLLKALGLENNKVVKMGTEDIHKLYNIDYFEEYKAD